MIEVWKAKDGLPDEVLPGPLGHTSGLLCRRHAQHSMRLPKELTSFGWESAQAIERQCRITNSRPEN